MAIELNDNIHAKINRPTDFRFGPFESIAQANSIIPIAQRYHGLLFGVYTDPGSIATSDLTFYYYWNALADVDVLPLSGRAPVDGEYVDQAAMIASQTSQPQRAEYIYYDGTSYWEYLGTTNGDITDYREIGGFFGVGAGLSLDDTQKVQLGNDGAGIIDFSDDSVFASGITFLYNSPDISLSSVFADGEFRISTNWDSLVDLNSSTANLEIQSSATSEARIDLSKGVNGLSQRLLFDPITNLIQLTDQINSKGLEYFGDYEANFTARSLVTKQYVDGVGGSKWTSVGTDIYRNSKVLVGTATFTDPLSTLEVAGRVSQSGLGNNTYFGFEAGLSDNTGINGNTAFGHRALRVNVGTPTLGIDNSAFGDQTLLVNTTGHTNTGIGKGALYANTSGYLNTALGARALLFNTTGYWNTASGANALISNTSGRHNTAIGLQSLNGNTTGIENTSIGTRALEDIVGTSSNVGIGYLVGKGRSGFSQTILIGNSTIPAASNQTNQIVIGHNAVGNGSDTTTVGNSSTLKTFLKGKLNIGALESPAVGAVTNIGIDTSGNIVAGSGGVVGAGIGLSLSGSNIKLGDGSTLSYIDTPTVKDFFLYQLGANNLSTLYSAFGATSPSLSEAGFASTNNIATRGAEIKTEYDSASPNPLAKIQINSGTGLFNVFSSDQTTGYRVRDDIHQRGLVEHADYSANKTDLSYTTIAWLKSRTNYNASVAQYFTHDASGVFAWVNI